MTLGRYSHLFSDDLTKAAKALNKAALAASDSPPEWTAVLLRYQTLVYTSLCLLTC